MATQGPLYPGTVTTLSTGTESANDWLTPGNISADDAAEAQITAATFDSPDVSFQLIAANFGFTIGATDTINGITVEIDRRSIIASSGVDFRVQLRDASGTLVGTNKASATVWPSTLTIATYGGAADTWTASPTPAMVNDPDFGVVLSASANIANADIGVDFIRVTITYTPDPNATATPATVAGVGTISSQTVLAAALTSVSTAAIVASVPTPTIDTGAPATPQPVDETGFRAFGTGVPFVTERGLVVPSISGIIGIDELGHVVFGLPIQGAVATPATVAAVATVPTVTVTGTVEIDVSDLIVVADVPGVTIQIIPTPQKARPDGDQSIGTWTTDTGATTNLWQAIDETVASDTDYVKSAANPSANELIVTLSNVVDPELSTGHEVRFRYRKA